MPDLASQPAEIRFTVEITRAETGLKEYVEMAGHIQPDTQNTDPAIEGDTP